MNIYKKKLNMSFGQVGEKKLRQRLCVWMTMWATSLFWSTLFEYSFLIKKKLISRLDAKRLIGRKFEDSTVQSDMKHWPFDVINDGGKPKIQVDYKGEQKTFFPEEISSMVLVRMKEIAEAYLGKVCLTINCT